jgi:hypothetical protein
LPNPSLCISCQKAKSNKLPFSTNDSRSITYLVLYIVIFGVQLP